MQIKSWMQIFNFFLLLLLLSVYILHFSTYSSHLTKFHWIFFSMLQFFFLIDGMVCFLSFLLYVSSKIRFVLRFVDVAAFFPFFLHLLRKKNGIHSTSSWANSERFFRCLVPIKYKKRRAEKKRVAHRKQADWFRIQTERKQRNSYKVKFISIIFSNSGRKNVRAKVCAGAEMCERNEWERVKREMRKLRQMK